MDEATLARFLAKVERDPVSGCWLWTGSAGPYGFFSVDGRLQLAHRVSFSHFVEAIPDGLCVLHRCDTPACVNPSHLFVGTHADNQADKIAKGRARSRPGPGNAAAAAGRRAITHCPSGHPYDAENTKVYQGRRYCRECSRIDGRERMRRKRAASRRRADI
jgi:hypothetical protein